MFYLPKPISAGRQMVQESDDMYRRDYVEPQMPSIISLTFDNREESVLDKKPLHAKTVFQADNST